MRRLAVLAAAIALAGCATPYQDMGLTGGLTVENSADGTTLIRGSGNGYTTEAAIRDYVWLRAAELTLAAGHRCFEVVASHVQMEHVSGSTAYGTYDHLMPSGRLRMRMLPGATTCGEGDAQKLVAELKPKVADPSSYKPKK